MKSALWVTVERWGTRVINLCVFAFLSRVLSTSDVGIASYATAVMTIALLIGDFGIGTALVQHDSMTPSSVRTATWLSGMSGIGLAAVIALSAPFVGMALNSGEVSTVLLLMVPAVYLQSLCSVSTGLWTASFDFKRLASRRLQAALLGGLAAVCVAVSGGGYLSVVAQATVASVASIMLVRKSISWRALIHLPARTDLRRLTALGSANAAVHIISYGTLQLVVFIVGATQGLTAVGYYVLAYNVYGVLFELASAGISAVAIPAFARFQAFPREAAKSYLRLSRLSSVVLAPVFAFVAFNGGPFLRIVFGARWQPAVSILGWLAVVGLLMSVLGFDRSVLLGLGRPRRELGLTVLTLVSTLAVVAVSASHGAVAVAEAQALRGWALWPINLILMKRLLGLKYTGYLRIYAPPFAAGITAAVVARMATDHVQGDAIKALLSMVTMFFVYLGTLFAVDRARIVEFLMLMRPTSKDQSTEVVAT